VVWVIFNLAIKHMINFIQQVLVYYRPIGQVFRTMQSVSKFSLHLHGNAMYFPYFCCCLMLRINLTELLTTLIKQSHFMMSPITNPCCCKFLCIFHWHKMFICPLFFCLFSTTQYKILALQQWTSKPL